VQIDKSHLSFFGQVPLGQKSINLPSYKDEFGFQVKPGDAVFRWTDTELRNQDRLADLRTLSESIVLQLDTKTLGYFWDPVYKGTAKPSSHGNNPIIQDLELDPINSKLWIKQSSKPHQEKQWISYSFHDISKNPVAKRAALRATPVWSTSNPSNMELAYEADRLELDAVDAIAKLVRGMSILDKEIDDNLDSLIYDPFTGIELGTCKSRTSRHRLKSERWMPQDLNQVMGVAREKCGGAQISSAFVFYESDLSSEFEVLKAVVDDNKVRAIYGLSPSQALRDESRFAIDLNGDGFLG